MFYRVEIQDHIRVPPDMFDQPRSEAITRCIKKDYEGYISKDLGVVIDVDKVKDFKEGVIIPGDGAAYYATTFELLVYRPELQEVMLGQIKDIADFGAFINLGPIEGMIHVSQTMDDFVSFSKEKVLSGKESKKVLRTGDKCRARIIAVSFKDVSNPKLGLTMRQDRLGRLDWLNEEEEEKKEEKVEKKVEKKGAKKK